MKGFWRCGCTSCPFCGSLSVMLLDDEHCECMDCDEEWRRVPCCGDECELDHDFVEEDD